MPILSVIIPVYNAQNTIEKCLNSVLNQTLDDIEIIVINDFSTDLTLKLLENYKNKITLINNEKNEGPGASRNKGIVLAGGKYIGFVDNDDFIEPNYFETLVNTAEKDNAEVCVCLKIKNHKLGKTRTHLLPPKNLREIVFVKRTAPWAKIIRRDFLIQNNIKFDFSRGEDIYPAFLCAYYAKKIAYVKNTAYHCNILENSISHRQITSSDLSEVKIYKKIFNLIENSPQKKYFQKLTQKRGMISFDFLYKKAAPALKKKIITLYKEIFNQNPIFKYKIWQITNFFEKASNIIRANISR